MTDYLHTRLTHQESLETGALALAHVGDAVFELLVRGYLCKKGGRSARTLHKKTVAMVSANAQAKAMERLLPILTEHEAEVRATAEQLLAKDRLTGAEFAAIFEPPVEETLETEDAEVEVEVEIEVEAEATPETESEEE